MKVLLAQLNPIIGDLYGNYKKVLEVIAFSAPKNDLIVFPELTLTGYPPNDLLLRRGFVEEQLEHLDFIRKATVGKEYTVLIGAAVKNETGMGKPLFNAAIAYRNGQEIFRYYKQLLPTYNIFDENRYFESGSGKQFTNELLMVLDKAGKQHFLGVLICEDCWNDEAIADVPLYATNPVKNLDYERIEAVITLNASPSNINKHKMRYEMYSTLSKKVGLPFVYVNSVGGQDSLIFDGHSFVVKGDKIIYAAGFNEHLLSVDLEDIEHPKEAVIVPDFDKNQLIVNHLVLGLKDYLSKNGFTKVVVGSSGGIDSAVVLMLAVLAVGPNNVFAVTMPSKFSSAGSVDDSVELCDKLDIKLYTRPIVNDVMLAIEEYKKAFGEDPKRVTIENLQARIRGRVLMEYSNQTGALVLSTGNKSEMSVGYCTIYGDMCGGLSVIADLYKMEVYAIAEHYNKRTGNYTIPKNIVEKPPSAELWEGQKDTDSLPPYPVLDSLLKLYLERDLMTHFEIQAAKRDIEHMSLKEIKRILKMVDNAEFKRRQAPPVLRIHPRAFGFGRNLPIAQRYPTSYESVL